MKAWLRAAVVAASVGFGSSPASALSLTTLFAAAIGDDGNAFDVVVGPNDLTITAFDLHVTSSTSFVEFYIVEGGAAPVLNDLAAWTFVGSASVTGAGFDLPTFFDPADVVLSAGTRYGLYLTTTDLGLFLFSGGAAVGAVAASNADLTIEQGWGGGYPLDSISSPRVWNGTIYYERSGATVVPVPAALPLAALGVGALALVGRRRRKG